MTRTLNTAVIAILVAATFCFGSIAAADTRGSGVFITSNGSAYVHGATVMGTSSSGFTAVTNLQGNTITWNVLASSTTAFGKKIGAGLSGLASIAVGDIVSFFGKVSGTGSILSVDASVVKEIGAKPAKATTTKAEHKRGDRVRTEGKDNGLHLGWYINAHIKDLLKLKNRGTGSFGDQD